MRTLHAVSLASLIVTVTTAAPARAGHPPIVLELHVGDRPADAAQVLAPMLEELAKARFAAGPDAVGRAFEQAASRPSLTGGLPAELVAQLQTGVALWTNGSFDEAERVLAPLIDRARQSSGAFVDRKLQPPLEQALVALSLSQLKLGDRGAARQTMAEALRGNPDLKLPRAQYGQDAAELFAETVKGLQAAGVGKVSIHAEGGAIYVNERLIQMNATDLQLVPGEYRVFAQFGDALSRTHKLVVQGGDLQSLTIDAAFDRAVHTAPDWTGFAAPSDLDRERDGFRHAAAFARALDAEAVVVVGIDQRDRRRAYAALLNLRTGAARREAYVDLTAGASASHQRSLVRYVVDNSPPPPGTVVTGPLPPVQVGPRPGSMWGGWKYLAGGAAVGAAAAGTVFLIYDGNCSKRTPHPSIPGETICPNHYNLTTQGWLSITGAALFAGVTAYLFVRERSSGGRESRRQAYVLPAPGGALAGFSTSF